MRSGPRVTTTAPSPRRARHCAPTAGITRSSPPGAAPCSMRGDCAECLPVWKRMVEDGANEYERDLARSRLMNALVHQGRIREALRFAEARPGFAGSVSPEWLAKIHQVGHPRTNSPEALEAARR